MGEVSLESALQRHFGYDQFRPMQREIIARTLGGKHSLVLMPTGMGKSMCFQLPALMRAEEARQAKPLRSPLTLVISPLIALMQDQVEALRARGIAATFVNSILKRETREERYAQIAEGEYDLLYLTPERFRKPDFLKVIERRDVGLLAVDEAHCISEWGHDFRPDYTRLADIRERLGNPVTIALTATATPAVQEDIIRQLGLAAADMQIFNTGFDRPNLSLEVKSVWGDDEKLAEIGDVVKAMDGAGIIYFTLIRTLERFSESLRQRRQRHLVYHGDLPRGERQWVLEQFQRSDHHVLATNAFGMGIDKESVRFVVHAELPGSLESYSQEIGRAGRDGLPSRCLLLYDPADLETQMEFLRWSNPQREFYQRVYDMLVHEAESVHAFGEEWLAERLHARQRHDHRLETALAMLERHGVLEGSLRPLRIDRMNAFPDDRLSASVLEGKLRRDQEKLLALVEYARCDAPDRRPFLNRYFGAW